MTVRRAPSSRSSACWPTRSDRCSSPGRRGPTRRRWRSASAVKAWGKSTIAWNSCCARPSRISPRSTPIASRRRTNAARKASPLTARRTMSGATTARPSARAGARRRRRAARLRTYTPRAWWSSRAAARSTCGNGVSAEDEARGLFFEALARLGGEDYAGAEARLREAHRLVPGRVSVLTNLSAALLRQDKAAEAVQYAERSVALDPGNADGWLNLAACRTHTGAFAEALACSERSIAARPDHPDGWSSRGAALLELQRAEEALESCDHAISLQAAHAEAWSNRGIALNALRRSDEAMASYRKATELEPRSAQAWTNLAVALGDLGGYEESAACYEKALARKRLPFALGDRLRARM